MRTFEVLVTRDATESAVITVTAQDARAAGIAALDVADTENPDWQLNDNGGYDAYLGSGLDDVTEKDTTT